MSHDNCYGAQGYFSCDCDKRLIAEIDRTYALMKPGRERITASVVKAFFWLNAQRC
ncbi:hypothetical protein [Bowdeniella nasicola]|uniref:hypothetical protein n=1 Tax=Bowdeniella nasicola TaxID=208480 RepID=UPI0013011F9D|nr:hypothetical protein [Bowdeniella nasicola]